MGEKDVTGREKSRCQKKRELAEVTRLSGGSVKEEKFRGQSGRDAGGRRKVKGL